MKEDAIEVWSSQDTIEGSQEKQMHPPAAAQTNPLKRQLEWFCSENRCMVRIKADGTEERSEMAPGPDGFAISTFPNESPVPTECPNLLIMGPKSKKRPAAALSVQGAAEGEAVETKEEPERGAEEASAADDGMRVTKKILYSRIYHRERTKAKSEGCNDDEAKARASRVAQKAVQQAEAAGRLA